MNLLAGKPADRVPVAFFHHFCPPNERGKGLENQETFERSVIGRKLARKKFGPDAIKIMNGTLMMIPADGSFEKNSKRFAQCNTPAVDSAFAKNSGAGQRVRDFYEDSGAPCICHQLLSVPDAVQHSVPMHTGPEECGRCWDLRYAWINGKPRHAAEAKHTHAVL